MENDEKQGLLNGKGTIETGPFICAGTKGNDRRPSLACEGRCESPGPVAVQFCFQPWGKGEETEQTGPLFGDGTR